MTHEGHLVQVRLTRDQMRFMEQERRRLKKAYGLRITITEIIRALVEQHHMRMAQQATAEPESVEWFYRYLSEKKDESAPRI